jgi:hypothetical protein
MMVHVDLKLDYRDMYELAKFVVQKKEEKHTPELLQIFVLEFFHKGLLDTQNQQ